MREYLLCVAGIVLFASILIGILPNGKTAELIKSVMVLACLLTILSPIVSFFVGEKDMEAIFGESGIETQSGFIQYFSEQRIAETEERLKSELSKISEKVSKVEIDWLMTDKALGIYEGQEIQIESIAVYIEGEYNFALVNQIEGFISSNYGCRGVVESLEKIDKK